MRLSYDSEALKRELTRDEGRRLMPYRDTLGNWTVGVGHLLRGSEIGWLINLPTGQPKSAISEEDCDDFLRSDIIDAEHNLDHLLPGWRWLDDVRQRALINLSFNLGGRLGEFKRFLAEMENRDFDRAANALVASRWYGQVKTRGPRIVRMVKEGKAWGDEA